MRYRDCRRRSSLRDPDAVYRDCKPRREPVPIHRDSRGLFSLGSMATRICFMTLTEHEQKLVSGDRTAVFNFTDSEECIAVDHRAEEEPIFEDVQARLPAGHFQFEFDGERRFSVTCGGRTEQFELEYSPEDRYRALRFINGMIRPDYEMKILRCRYGDDTHSFLLRPSVWWSEFTKAYPAKVGELFIDLNEKSCFH